MIFQLNFAKRSCFSIFTQIFHIQTLKEKIADFGPHRIVSRVTFERAASSRSRRTNPRRGRHRHPITGHGLDIGAHIQITSNFGFLIQIFDPLINLFLFQFFLFQILFKIAGGAGVANLAAETGTDRVKIDVRQTVSALQIFVNNIGGRSFIIRDDWRKIESWFS